jgi:lipid-A-disaccharide synthase-like uncharacterized protein
MRVVFSIFCLLGLCMVAWSLQLAYREQRIPYGRFFFRILYAEKDRKPKLFWFIVVVDGAIGVQLFFWMLNGPVWQ